MKIKHLANPVILSKITLFLAIVFPLSGCQQEITPQPFDGARAFAEVAALVEFSPRDAGTPEGWKAAEKGVKKGSACEF